METKMHKLLAAEREAKFATEHGTQMHLRLQRMSLDAPREQDAELAAHIVAIPELADFFRAPARAEVPIAGTINGRFISRRIDRMIIDDDAKTVRILDYKTDIDHTARHAEYVAQIGEYVALMRKIRPGYKISAFILWLHDWTMERV